MLEELYQEYLAAIEDMRVNDVLMLKNVRLVVTMYYTENILDLLEKFKVRIANDDRFDHVEINIVKSKLYETFAEKTSELLENYRSLIETDDRFEEAVKSMYQDQHILLELHTPIIGRRDSDGLSFKALRTPITYARWLETFGFTPEPSGPLPKEHLKELYPLIDFLCEKFLKDTGASISNVKGKLVYEFDADGKDHADSYMHELKSNQPLKFNEIFDSYTSVEGSKNQILLRLSIKNTDPEVEKQCNEKFPNIDPYTMEYIIKIDE